MKLPAALRAWVRGLAISQSVSAKVLLLLGVAAAVIILLALVIPWVRMRQLVAAGERGACVAILGAWAELPAGDDGRRPDRVAGASVAAWGRGPDGVWSRSGGRPADTPLETDTDPAADPVTGPADEPDLQPLTEPAAIAGLLRAFRDDPDRREVFTASWDGWARRYELARVTRDDAGEPAAVVVVERLSADAGRRLAVNSLSLLAAGSAVLGVALVLLADVLSRLVLRPVQLLREWAERVREGETDERPELATGDEFQRLAETFGLLLDELEERRRKLQAVNAAMDLKLNELSEANEELDQAARVKNEFLGNVSHELRTPLNSIIGFAELLTDMARRDIKEHRDGAGEVPAHLFKRQRYLENISTAARGLLELIEGLLEMARIEAGRVELRTERVDISQICRGLVGMIEPLAQRKGVELTLEPERELPTIETDRRKLQQIVFNLLSNAVKFTDPQLNGGRPGRVAVRAERLSDFTGPMDQTGPSEAVRVSVLDNGPGIEPEDQSVIFEKFRQLRTGHAREYGGTGLGLAISRELAELLGGQIQLVSEPGRGSMFSLILPLSPPAAADARAPRQRPTAAS